MVTKPHSALRLFMILASLFICSLVVSNLIFQKFISLDFFGFYTFKISVGVLPYPITFLVTDIISEIFGKKKANLVVTAGIFASLFSLLILYVAQSANAIEDSPIDNEVFTNVFGKSVLAVLASMLAYLFAQYIDIAIYHYWKKKTNGKHLWLRNNFSTFSSQFIDTFSVLFLMCFFGLLPWNMFEELLISGFLFKVLMALFDTPFLYLFVKYFQKQFNLNVNEELEF